MVHFSYCFSLTLIHSLWQAALLLCAYIGFNALTGRNNPAIKQNSLFLLLFAQVFISVSTFIIYYSGAGSVYTSYVSGNLAALFQHQAFIDQLAPRLIAVYTTLFLFKSGHLFYTWNSFKKNSRSCLVKPAIELKLFTKVKSLEFGISRKVTLWYSKTISTPMTFGFIKPVILLPLALLNHISLEETETIIIHELTHIRNNDYFLNWVLVICETVFFFNPFIHLIGNQIRLEREKSCDAQVLQFNYTPIRYAETLLKTASLKNKAGIFSLAAAVRNTQLFTRIHFFTNEKNLQFHKRNYISLVYTLAIFIFVFNVCLLNFSQKKLAANNENIYFDLPVAILNTTITNHIPATAEPLVAEDSRMAEKAALEATKQNLYAIAAKELATLAAAPVSNPDITEPVISEPDVENIVFPVALRDANDTKEITLIEENSATGKSLTKVYKMKFINGEWNAILLWTITEKRPENDSCVIIRDTTNYFNPVQ